MAMQNKQTKNSQCSQRYFNLDLLIIMLTLMLMRSALPTCNPMVNINFYVFFEIKVCKGSTFNCKSLKKNKYEKIFFN